MQSTGCSIVSVLLSVKSNLDLLNPCKPLSTVKWAYLSGEKEAAEEASSGTQSKGVSYKFCC